QPRNLQIEQCLAQERGQLGGVVEMQDDRLLGTRNEPLPTNASGLVGLVGQRGEGIGLVVASGNQRQQGELLSTECGLGCQPRSQCLDSVVAIAVTCFRG